MSPPPNDNLQLQVVVPNLSFHPVIPFFIGQETETIKAIIYTKLVTWGGGGGGTQIHNY